MSARKYPKGLSRELSAWRVMLRRCTEPGFKDWKYYGGNGITVCREWAESFDAFLLDVGPSPTRTSWLGRLNTAGNYEPGNVAWTNHEEQMRRRQFCRLVTIRDQVMTAAEAGRLPGLPTRNSVLYRVAGGFSLEAPQMPKLYRASPWLTYEGQCLPLPAWAKRIGLPRSLLWQRIKAGMPVDRVLHPERLEPYRF